MDWTSVFTVEDGDLVTITASDSARFGTFGPTVGPDGAGGPMTPDDGRWPLAGAPPYALIGNIAGGQPFLTYWRPMTKRSVYDHNLL